MAVEAPGADAIASYREELEAWALAAGSDGCTAVPDFFRVCCLEHDHAYVTGATLRGVPVTKMEADMRFRDCIQRHSSFRWLSPMSWWRWFAVRKFGKGIWNKQAVRILGVMTPREEAAWSRRMIFREVFGGAL